MIAAIPESAGQNSCEIGAGKPVTLEFLVADYVVHLEHHASEEPVCVEMPPIQLEQVLLNLLFNACDASPNGGRVDVRVQSEGDQVVIDVADTGSGMDANAREKAFEPFFSTRADGTGLGLAIVQNLVEENGGSVSLSSTPGQGTTVTVRLPRAD